MRSLYLAGVVVAALGTALVAGISVSAQTSTTPHKKVFGYQDPQTGLFHPSNGIAPDAAVAPATGTLELVLTITLKTPLTKGGSVLCSADVVAESENTNTYQASSFEDEATSVATVSGSTATCTVNIPYSWPVPAASSTVENTVSGSYVIEMTGAAGTVNALPRYSSAPFVTLTKVPSTGTVSKYTVAAVI